MYEKQWLLSLFVRNLKEANQEAYKMADIAPWWSLRRIWDYYPPRNEGMDFSETTARGL